MNGMILHYFNLFFVFVKICTIFYNEFFFLLLLKMLYLNQETKHACISISFLVSLGKKINTCFVVQHWTIWQIFSLLVLLNSILVNIQMENLDILSRILPHEPAWLKNRASPENGIYSQENLRNHLRSFVCFLFLC